MSFTYNPHHHVKIWLSKNPNWFLNHENQLRLIRMRKTNPTDEINFVYDSRLLSEKAKEQLKLFCQKYNIVPQDVCSLLNSSLLTANEQQLAAIYQQEIDFANGGNLGAASDILRWISTVYQLGTYSDFDVPVNTKGLNATIKVNSPFLMNIGSISSDLIESVALNNDTMAIVDKNASATQINAIQQAIIQAYNVNQSDSIFSQILTWHSNQIKQLSFSMKNIIHAVPDEFKIFLSLAKLYSGKSPVEIRRSILAATASNDSFFKAKDINGREFSDTADASRDFRAGYLAIMATSIETNPALYKDLQARLNLDDTLLCDLVREEFRKVVLKNSVTCATGPYRLLSALYSRMYFTDNTLDLNILNASFAHYGLEKHFLSKNSILPHTKAEDVRKFFSIKEAGVLNDVSWLAQGEEATLKRERDFQAQRDTQLSVVRQELMQHKLKIECDLSGCFGWYRFSQRQAKIAAITAILAHFDANGKFHAADFNRQKKNYYSNSIFASFGQSRTQLLIEKMTQLSDEADFCSPDDNIDVQPGL